MKSVKLDGTDIYPSKIVCIGRNYVDHIKELGNEIPEEPVIFIKPNSSIAKEIHSSARDVIHFEGEITFLIRSGELRGVGFGLDLTKREVQDRLKAKGGCPGNAQNPLTDRLYSVNLSLSAVVINELRMALYINGSLVQHGGCDLMLNKPSHILSEAKRFLSFEDGDLIMSGTPKRRWPASFRRHVYLVRFLKKKRCSSKVPGS